MPQENEHLKKFQVTWELHNKHLFESLVFSEPILHGSLPALVAQLKYAPPAPFCVNSVYNILVA